MCKITFEDVAAARYTPPCGFKYWRTKCCCVWYYIALAMVPLWLLFDGLLRSTAMAYLSSYQPIAAIIQIICMLPISYFTCLALGHWKVSNVSTQTETQTTAYASLPTVEAGVTMTAIPVDSI